MFKVPKSLTHIDVLGIQVKIVINQARCERENAYGLFDGTIVLRSKYENHVDFMKTLSHEAFHASCAISGLQLDLQIEEVMATSSERLFVSLTETLSDMYSQLYAEEAQEAAKAKKKTKKKKK